MAHKFFDDAQIKAAYTLNSWFVTLSPWFEGDSMVVDFVRKGSQGKDTIQVYVSLRKFEKLLGSIKDGSFKKTLASDDKTDNPGAWSYRTGANGSKTFAIGLGKKNAKTGQRSIVFHGYDATKKKDQNADVPVLWDDLEEIAENYDLIVGEAPKDNVWHRMLHQSFWKAYENKKKFFEKAADDEETVSEVVPTEDVSADKANKASKKTEKAESRQEVLLKSYVKDGDVISFDGEVEGSPAILRVPASEMGGKDKSEWTRASAELKASQKAVITLMLRNVRGNEYTILGVAK